MARFKLILTTRSVWLLVAAVVIALVVGLLTPTGGRLTSTNPYPLATGDVIRVSGAVMLP